MRFFELLSLLLPTTVVCILSCLIRPVRSVVGAMRRNGGAHPASIHTVIAFNSSVTQAWQAGGYSFNSTGVTINPLDDGGMHVHGSATAYCVCCVHCSCGCVAVPRNVWASLGGYRERVHAAQKCTCKLQLAKWGKSVGKLNFHLLAT